MGQALTQVHGLTLTLILTLDLDGQVLKQVHGLLEVVPRDPVVVCFLERDDGDGVSLLSSDALDAAPAEAALAVEDQSRPIGSHRARSFGLAAGHCHRRACR